MSERAGAHHRDGGTTKPRKRAPKKRHDPEEAVPAKHSPGKKTKKSKHKAARAARGPEQSHLLPSIDQPAVDTGANQPHPPSEPSSSKAGYHHRHSKQVQFSLEEGAEDVASPSNQVEAAEDEVPAEVPAEVAVLDKKLEAAAQARTNYFSSAAMLKKKLMDIKLARQQEEETLVAQQALLQQQQEDDMKSLLVTVQQEELDEVKNRRLVIHTISEDQEEEEDDDFDSNVTFKLLTGEEQSAHDGDIAAQVTMDTWAADTERRLTKRMTLAHASKAGKSDTQSTADVMESPEHLSPMQVSHNLSKLLQQKMSKLQGECSNLSSHHRKTLAAGNSSAASEHGVLMQKLKVTIEEYKHVLDAQEKAATLALQQQRLHVLETDRLKDAMKEDKLRCLTAQRHLNDEKFRAKQVAEDFQQQLADKQSELDLARANKDAEVVAAQKQAEQDNAALNEEQKNEIARLSENYISKTAGVKWQHTIELKNVEAHHQEELVKLTHGHEDECERLKMMMNSQRKSSQAAMENMKKAMDESQVKVEVDSANARAEAAEAKRAAAEAMRDSAQSEIVLLGTRVLKMLQATNASLEESPAQTEEELSKLSTEEQTEQLHASITKLRNQLTKSNETAASSEAKITELEVSHVRTQDQHSGELKKEQKRHNERRSTLIAEHTVVAEEMNSAVRAAAEEAEELRAGASAELEAVRAELEAKVLEIEYVVNKGSDDREFMQKLVSHLEEQVSQLKAQRPSDNATGGDDDLGQIRDLQQELLREKMLRKSAVQQAEYVSRLAQSSEQAARESKQAELEGHLMWSEKLQDMEQALERCERQKARADSDLDTLKSSIAKSGSDVSLENTTAGLSGQAIQASEVTENMQIVRIEHSKQLRQLELKLLKYRQDTSEKNAMLLTIASTAEQASAPDADQVVKFGLRARTLEVELTQMQAERDGLQAELDVHLQQHLNMEFQIKENQIAAQACEADLLKQLLAIQDNGSKAHKSAIVSSLQAESAARAHHKDRSRKNQPTTNQPTAKYSATFSSNMAAETGQR
jgi:hypothetical protein